MSRAKPLAPALLALLALSAAPGCFGPLFIDDDRDDDDGCDPRATNGRCFFVDRDGDGVDDLDDDDWDADDPAEVEVAIATAEAALGPADVIVIDVLDDSSTVIDVQVTFAHTVWETVENGASSMITGAELGEGYGNVVVDAADDAGNVTTVTIGDVLVDLTPPVAEVSPCVIAADGGEFTAWIGDAWALGSVELHVRGAGASETSTAASAAFPAWPSTFRTAWDWSYFAVPASALPVGAGDATLVVTDRVGNAAGFSCALVVDAVAPLVALAATIGADGVITATITTSDDVTDGALLTVTLAARAVPLAESVGAVTTFTLDAADFASGPLPLEGRARDRAGNEGVSTVVAVDVP
ncbi:MAG: hypothetical protein A2138_02015 [Deltaproteobacteria bacterium RBG_16_71_12]|nr:MAG: hypothetical protein A2138_02015 [Deltaproteobacteria bacterium RBG_16_71_12]